MLFCALSLYVLKDTVRVVDPGLSIVSGCSSSDNVFRLKMYRTPKSECMLGVCRRVVDDHRYDGAQTLCKFFTKSSVFYWAEQLSTKSQYNDGNSGPEDRHLRAFTTGRAARTLRIKHNRRSGASRLQERSPLLVLN